MNASFPSYVATTGLFGRLQRAALVAALAGPMNLLVAQTLYVPGGTVGSSSTGNVGIGIASPSYKLELSANSSGEPTSLKLDGGATNGMQIRMGDNYSGTIGTAYSYGATFVASNAYQTTFGTNSWSKGSSSYGSTMAFFGISSSTSSPAFQVLYSPAGTATGAFASFFTSNLLTILGNGNVGIGTANPTYPLAVNGTIEAKAVIVQTGWSDYVFDRDYRLASLPEVESYIKAEHHLPGLPSAKQVAKDGVSLGDMQSKLLAQIEQLTLHQIEQEKRLDEQETAMRAQSGEIAALKRENAALRTGSGGSQP